MYSKLFSIASRASNFSIITSLVSKKSEMSVSKGELSYFRPNDVSLSEIYLLTQHFQNYIRQLIHLNPKTQRALRNLYKNHPRHPICNPDRITLLKIISFQFLPDKQDPWFKHI